MEQERPDPQSVLPSLSAADLVPDHVSALRLRNRGHHMCTMVGFTAPGNWEEGKRASSSPFLLGAATHKIMCIH